MQTGPLLAVALLGGFAAGSVGGLLFSPTATEGGDEPLLAAVEGGDSSRESLDAKYRALEARNAQLEAAVDSLEMTVQSLANRREPVATVKPETSPEAASSGAQYAENDAVPYTLEEELRFAAYLDNVEKQKEAEREAERERRREEQMARRVDRMAEELGLNDYQKGEMTRVLSEQETATREYFTKMREAGDWDREAVRAGMEDLNAKMTNQLAGFLNPTQLEQYQSSNQGMNRFFGGDRRGGGGGRPGGDRQNNNDGGGRGGF